MGTFIQTPPVDEKKSSRFSLPLWLKYLFALLPLVIIFKSMHVREMVDVAANTRWWTIPFLVVAVLFSMFLQGVRWWMLLRAFIMDIPFWKVIGCHFAGLFYSIVLPTSAAGDFVRAALIAKENDYAVVWGSSWISRIWGVLALCVLSVYGLASIDVHRLPHGFFISMVSIIALFGVLLYLSFSKKMTKRIRPIASRMLPQALSKIVENIRQGIYLYRNKKRVLVSVFLMTLIVQIMIVGTASILIAGITGKFFLVECMAYVPIVEILTMSLPITPNGLGIREALITLMFAHIGLSKEQAGVYILLGFMAIALKLSGAVPVLAGLIKKRPRKIV
jgi:glycosyltransferase 2 family protein